MHYCVLVVGEDYKKVLKPFQEHNMGDCPPEYLEFSIKNKKENFKTDAKKIIQDLEKKEPRPDYYYEYKKWFDSGEYTEIFDSWDGGELNEETGDWGRWHNPNSHWDWYELGGRYRGFFKLKDEFKYVNDKRKVGRAGVGNNAPSYDSDQARKIEIDLDGMKALNRLQAEKDWDEAHKKLENKEIIQDQLNWQYSIKAGMTKEQYLENQGGVCSYAICYQGQWIERDGDLIEWLKKWEEIFNSLPDDALLTIVDCHE